MGNCIFDMSSLGGVYTIEEFQEQMASQVIFFNNSRVSLDTLPRLQRSAFGDNVLELKGTEWIFNPAPPFDSSILRDKLSVDDYTSAIRNINTAHLHRLVGETRIVLLPELPKRRQMGKEAVQATLVELNYKAVGYHWDLQAGQTTTTVAGVNNYGDQPQVYTEHKQETSLLLVFDNNEEHGLAQGSSGAYNGGY